MNLFKEEISRSYLEHSQKGQTWGKHKYIAIKNGRYIYPEDLKKGGGSIDRSRQINDQIKSAHSNATSSNMKLTSGSELKRRQKMRDLNAGADSRRSMKNTGTSKEIESGKRAAQKRTERTFGKAPGTEELEKQIKKTAERKKQAEASKSTTSTTSTKSSEELKSIADKIKANNTSSAPKKEEKKTESTDTSTETTTSTSTETKKSGSGKGRKGSSSKKSSSKKDTTKTDTNQTNTTTPASASEEAKALGLSEQDLQTLESSIDVNSTERESVIKSLALKVIRGDFGDGEDRKKKLGKYYAEIQKKVNEFMKEMKSSKNTQTASKEEVKHSDYATDVLCHHGVMGMKWGIRRYQNRDGSLTELGKRRLGVESVGDSPVEKRKAHAGIHANVATDNRNVGNVLNSTSSGVRTASGAAKKAANREREKKRREMDVSKMSDQDLQKAVNRMNLERNYKNLKTQDIATGKDYVADILDVVGDVASIGASAAMIASAIYMIKR